MERQLASTKRKIAALAFEKRDRSCGFGGFGTTVGMLTHYCDAGYETIIESLKELHTEGRVYLQYWHWQPNGFRPWTPNLPDTFFNDFRLLHQRPFSSQ